MGEGVVSKSDKEEWDDNKGVKDDLLVIDEPFLVVNNFCYRDKVFYLLYIS